MSTIRSAGAARLFSLLGLLAVALPVAAGDIVGIVDGAGSVGAASAMVVDGSGRPVIAYRDVANGDLKLATCTAGCGGSTPTWQIVTVDGAAGTNVGTDINLRLNFSGNPVIAYGVAGFPNTDDLKLATCYLGCDGPAPSWHIVTVDSAGSVGRYASMDLGYQTNPVISYFDATNGDLKVATCTADCQTATPAWQVVVVESAGVTGLYTSLKTDMNGNPIVAYRNQAAGELRLATCTAGCQGATPTWTIATVASGGVGFHVSMQLASGDVPVISYFDPFAASVKLATCLHSCRTAAPGWQLATVEAVEVLNTSLRLDANLRPMVAYYVSPVAQDLKLAHCTADCFGATPTWQITTVDSAGDVGASPSLALSGQMRAAVSYHDATNGDLKLALLGIKPSVVSVTRAGPSPTRATQVAFTVIFSAPVTGVDVSDFMIWPPSFPGASVNQVSGSGTTYTVTVNAGTGSGYLGLFVIDDDSIVFGTDALGGPGIGTAYVYGELYDIDTVAPTITSVGVPAAGNYVTGQNLDFRVSWSENVSTTTGYPSLAVTIGSATRQATYTNRIGNDWYFHYKVTAADNDEDGIAIAGALTLDGAVLRDDAGNAAAPGFPLVNPTTDVRVNRALVVTTPTTTSTVYTAGQAGMRSALQLNNGGRPVIAYEEWGTAIRISTCVANCTSASPTWVHAVVEPGNTLLGAMELNHGKPVVTYSLNGDLRIATCTANCESAAPTWVHATVEGGAWRRHALQLDGGIPVIAYVDAAGKLKTARCAADCATANPTWIKAQVDSGPENGYGSIWNPSMQLRDGKPVVTYDIWGTSLKYAACLSGCSTATPTWGVSTIDAVSPARSSLRLVAGAPIVAYQAQGDLKLATCVADCGTAAPAWQVVAVDITDNNTGVGASLQIADGRPVVSYYDGTNSRLRLASCTAGCSTVAPSWAFASLAIGGYLSDVDTSLQIAGTRAFISYHTWSDWNLEFATVEGVALSRSSSELVFGGQSRGTSSPAQSVTLTNGGMLPLPIASVTASDPQYDVAHDCVVLAPLASCTVAVSFSPDPAAGPLNSTAHVPATLTITSAAPGAPHTVSLSGVAERSLVTHYYRSILGRDADTGGKAFWHSEAARVAALGANVNEVWFALSATFYFSPEYLALNRNPTQFVTDLYRTFFNREPDSGGLAFWTGSIAQGMPREVVLVSYMFSAEFASFTNAVFGNTAARAEVDAVMDFYRSLLSRLPDDGGFNHWVGKFRTAQCAGATAVTAEVEAISSAFALSSEYAARNRSNAQYVGDLYNAFLRRGGDLGGVQFWIGQIDSGARTREQVRQAFRDSPEFQARVNAIISQGCFPG